MLAMKNLIILLALAGSAGIFAAYTDFTNSRDSDSNASPASKICEDFSKLARQGAEEIIKSECAKYYGKNCAQDSECGSFPCSNGECLIKPCTSDAECPSLCGLHATPVPGFCTTIDVA
ncbi:MAG: hypothetical protein J4400_01075 [Candidatus Aenigmarchaeota archaeon]|nr:hypothetical protein [Candidatus Aenigmarchaeota archaeon]